MSRANINTSGARGGGSSVKIYETPDYDYPRRGACVMHGSFTAGTGSPDRAGIEVVEIQLPYLDLRVRADDVRAELRALMQATQACRDAGWSDATLQAARHQAFVDLQTAVLGSAAREIAVGQLEQIARDAYEDGLRHGEEKMREQFRKMLGLWDWSEGHRPDEPLDDDHSTITAPHEIRRHGILSRSLPERVVLGIRRGKP